MILRVIEVLRVEPDDPTPLVVGGVYLVQERNGRPHVYPDPKPLGRSLVQFRTASAHFSRKAIVEVVR